LLNPKLSKLLQKAYSAEKAAAFAYIGHGGSIKSLEKKKEIKQIEDDEWCHREEVLKIMKSYNIKASIYYEFKYAVIGKFIGFSCYIIGWFMPYYFAGKLESGNVCEYFIILKHFHKIGIKSHDKELYEMGVKEKEHEDYFLNEIKDSKLMPFFQKLFFWGKSNTYNDVKLNELKSVENSDEYCEDYRKID
jgi:hypothetical protein